MSYSAKEDVYKILWLLDLTESEKERFNHEALAVYHDILTLAKDTDIVNEYVNIQLGYGHLTNDDYGKDIIQIIAERRGTSQDECEKLMQEEITSMIKLNKENWLDCILNQKIYKNVDHNKARPYFPDVNNQSIDYARKYIVKSRVQSHVEYPENLQDVINARQANEKRMDELKAIEFKSTSERHEYKKRINYNKSLNEDIQDLKKLYDFDYRQETVNTMNQSFNDDFEEVEDRGSENIIMDLWETDRIRKIANEVLNSKQLVIFYLHYENGFSQREISEILRLLKQDISRTLKTIKTKILEKM
jgi:DNA-directed RNA polymerase specialized sigma24 family protein